MKHQASILKAIEDAVIIESVGGSALALSFKGFTAFDEWARIAHYPLMDLFVLFGSVEPTATRASILALMAAQFCFWLFVSLVFSFARQLWMFRKIRRFEEIVAGWFVELLRRFER